MLGLFNIKSAFKIQRTWFTIHTTHCRLTVEKLVLAVLYEFASKSSILGVYVSKADS